MEIRDYIQFVRRRWWLLVLGPLVAGLSAFAVSKSMTPIYDATATMLVNQTQTPGVILYNDILTSERLTNTYAELVKRRPVLTEVRRRLGLPVTEEQLAAKVSVSTVRNTQLLRIKAEDPDPALATSIANTLAQAFIEDNDRQLGRPGTVSVVQEAAVPTSPVKPNIPLNVGLAIVLGLMLAGGIAMVLEYLDDTLKDAEDLEALGGISTLASINRFKPDKKSGLAFTERSDQKDSHSLESYRRLRTSIHFARFGSALKTILVTSANPREGKSTTVANLAIIMAQAGDKVIVVDTDLRRPSIHSFFKVQNSFGLTGLLLSETEDPAQALLPTRFENLRVLPSGPLPPNPSELLMSPPVAELMRKLGEQADYVIFDSPPIMAVTDASILASRSDGTILVVEAGKTRSQPVIGAAECIAEAKSRLVGVVLNKVKKRGRSYSYYYYGYRRAKPAVSEAVEPTAGSTPATD
jgi:polysaccharide biosynthesis transport protein